MLNPSDAVYGFAAWLSVRPSLLIISKSSSDEDIKKLATLVEIYLAANNLPEVSEGFQRELVFPEEI